MDEPGWSDVAPPRTVERSTSTSCPLSARTRTQLPAMTLTVPCSSVQRGGSGGTASVTLTGVGFSAAGSVTWDCAGGAAGAGSGSGLATIFGRSEEHTSELQSQFHLVCRL